MQNLLWVTQTDFIRGNFTMFASDLEFKLVNFKLFFLRNNDLWKHPLGLLKHSSYTTVDHYYEWSSGCQFNMVSFKASRHRSMINDMFWLAANHWLDSWYNIAMIYRWNNRTYTCIKESSLSYLLVLVYHRFSLIGV